MSTHFRTLKTWCNWFRQKILHNSSIEVPKNWHKSIRWTILTILFLEMSSPAMGTISGPEIYDFWGRPQSGVILKLRKLVSDSSSKVTAVGRVVGIGVVIFQFRLSCCWCLKLLPYVSLKPKNLAKLQLSILPKYLNIWPISPSLVGMGWNLVEKLCWFRTSAQTSQNWMRRISILVDVTLEVEWVSTFSHLCCEKGLVSFLSSNVQLEPNPNASVFGCKLSVCPGIAAEHIFLSFR